jgi:F-type H+-transporting ATPase subunit delta
VSVQIVARRYAQALLELGTEMGGLDGLVEQFSTLGEAWRASDDLRNALENPLVAHAAKKAVVVELCDQIGASQITKHTVQMLVDRRRIQTLPYVAQYLRELADKRKGVLRAEVTTAAPLGDAYYDRLRGQLERMTGKKVVLEKKTDATLVAGVVTRIGDRILDGSLRTRLQSLREALLPQA